jgi:dTDP-4-dehydrorhamnose 3,5-epimerase
MNFLPTSMDGLVLVGLEKHSDSRGFFARSWCEKEFEAAGLNARLSQCNLSYNQRKGTLRGLHFQEAPYGEAKLVRVVRGKVFDVVVDLRPQSPTLGQWESFTITSDDRLSLFIPEGMAHGFQTLEDDTELLYQMSRPYAPEFARTLAWNDPSLGIAWPITPPILSEKDARGALVEDFGILIQNK